ncbi:ribokinase [Halocynthiibacter namhaensis]|uniref:ribokinase n=1 Tax=Halocynthiibacter namhaensis TaxID=1290553 RepID=UPI0005794B26|nr:ribokinase [Halocynthiibacter namhaensis]
MTVFCLGSINADHVYQVPHLPAPGETLAATGFQTGLGGKGANQSVAAAKAGSETHHIGAVGADGAWTIDALQGYGVGTDHVRTSEIPTGHAIINVDPEAENAIVIFSGANYDQSETGIAAALSGGKPGDWILIQNETSQQITAAKAARSKGVKVAYSAAPFDADAARDMLPFADLLLVNEIEAAQLSQALGVDVGDLPVANVLITLGAKGVDLVDTETGEMISVPAFSVNPVDTTGAGDTFAGSFVSGLEQGMSDRDALIRASATSAIQVTRVGAATAIPDAAEVQAFIADQ